MRKNLFLTMVALASFTVSAQLNVQFHYDMGSAIYGKIFLLVLNGLQLLKTSLPINGVAHTSLSMQTLPITLCQVYMEKSLVN